MAHSNNSSAEATRLLADMEAGHTRGKVGVSDLAAAPLAADEEVAGTPVPLAAARDAFAQEVGTTGKVGRRRVDPHKPPDTRRFPWAPVALLVTIPLIAAVAASALLG